MMLLNLGCGTRFHPGWVNIDFAERPPHVRSYDLRRGIPVESELVDVVYHSHVLEHLSRREAPVFLQECYRVLKPGGFLRVAVPDLESIVHEYLQNLNRCLNGESTAEADYDWSMLELYDQAVRHRPGGDMGEYLSQHAVSNLDYVFSRIGEEGRGLRKALDPNRKQPSPGRRVSAFRHLLRRIRRQAKQLRKLRLTDVLRNQKAREQRLLGEFRLSGEVHQWMYDRYSLSRLLSRAGFVEIARRSAFESDIPNWSSYGLESKGKIVFKPDSLFMEARKP